MKALYLTVLLTLSCNKVASLNKEGPVLGFDGLQMNISHLEEVGWNVGKKKEVNVSQSFLFTIDMPRVKKEDLDYLHQIKGIDSWILRIVVVRGSQKQDLGSLYAPFRAKRIFRGQGQSSPSHVSAKIFYAAAYSSERFRLMNCPAFGHQKKLKSFDIQGPNRPLSFFFNQETLYPEKSQLIELAPTAFNGGHSLLGEYFIEVAFYNSEKKMVHGHFTRLPQSILVTEEKTIPIPSCLGEHSDT